MNEMTKAILDMLVLELDFETDDSRAQEDPSVITVTDDKGKKFEITVAAQ